MRTCPRCNASFPDDARFCPEDGTQLVIPGDGGDPQIGKVLLGQFEVREICGRGSMGTVYRARQASMDRDVAVKILRKDLLRDEKVVKRFHREARAAAKLNHANIITVHLVGDTDDGLPFIVMEYVTGDSLDHACTTAGGPLPVVRTIHIAKQIAVALTEAHSHNVVHRDLKPENILLTSRPNSPDFVKVLDFGIAKILYANDEPLTQTGAIFGTPHYLAPEQASGSDIDQRCDIYALGVILYRMAVGRLPFDSPSGMEVLIQHLQEEPPRPRDLLPTVPQALEDVILRCLAKAPADRYRSCEDLADALDRVVEGLRHATSFGMGAASPAASVEPRPYPPTQIGSAAPHDEQKAMQSDPRFQVPSDGELAAAMAATQDDLPDPASAASTAREDETEQVVHSDRSVGSTTVGLAQNIQGRRTVLLHGMLAAGSIVAGGLTGAVVHWLRRGGTGPIEPPPPGPDDETPAPGALPEPLFSGNDVGAGAVATPDAAANHQARPTPRPKHKKRGGKAKQVARRRKPGGGKVVKAPPPLGRVTDHHGDEEPVPPPKPTPPHKDPTPPATKKRADDFYDLID